MAGRGRRLGSYAERNVPLRRPGTGVHPPPFVSDGEVDLTTLMLRIDELQPTNINPLLLSDIGTLFQQLCTTKESVQNVLSNLHCKALCDYLFGEKVVLIMESLANLKIDGLVVRNELLKFVQNDFNVKETISQSDVTKFINSIKFLGGVFNKVKIQGKPITILGAALLDYFDLLLQGEEEQLQLLATQLYLNGDKLIQAAELEEKFQSLKSKIRRTLITRNLSTASRCWLLLSLDFLANDLQPLTGVIREFYSANLEDNYSDLESKRSHSSSTRSVPIGQEASARSGSSFSSQEDPNSPTAAQNLPPGLRDAKLSTEMDDLVNTMINSEVDNVRAKLRRQGLIPAEKEKQNRKWQVGEKLSDDEKAWGLKEKKKSNFNQHDDRCDRDDDFYGIQMPRKTKSDRKSQSSEERPKLNLNKSLDSAQSTQKGQSSLGSPEIGGGENWG